MRLIWRTIPLKTRSLGRRTLHSGSEHRKRERESVTRRERTTTRIASVSRRSWLSKNEKELKREG